VADEISELLKKALALSPAARAILAGSLLDSLDETVDEGAEAEWQKEIGRRHAGTGFRQSKACRLDVSRSKRTRWKPVPALSGNHIRDVFVLRRVG
jgi:Putative addiction module component